MSLLPEPENTLVLSAHAAYRLDERFSLTSPAARSEQVWSRDDLAERIGDAHVLVASGYWDNALLDAATNLRFIQVCAAGFDNYDTAAMAERGIRLCNASGVNAIAVAEHALGLTLALTRRLHTGRDHQKNATWRGMISSLSEREEELAGKTVLIYGAGNIGSRIARLMRAFEAKPIGIRRDPTRPSPDFDAMYGPDAFIEQLPDADVVILACPLTDETRGLMSREAFARMRPDAYFINVARGGCADEAALIEAVTEGRIAAAGIDVTEVEPLASDSPLWGLQDVLLTSHTAGETRAYEDRVVTILNENLARLWAGRDDLVNAIV